MVYFPDPYMRYLAWVKRLVPLIKIMLEDFLISDYDISLDNKFSLAIKSCKFNLCSLSEIVMISVTYRKFAINEAPITSSVGRFALYHDVIKWKRFLYYWPLASRIHRPSVVSLTKGSDVELWCFFVVIPEKLLNWQPRCRQYEAPWS